MNVGLRRSNHIDEFWLPAQECGFTSDGVHLVPANELDKRYAYFLLSKAV